MSEERIHKNVFYLIDAADYATFSELKAKTIKLEKEIAELLRYKDLHRNAEHAHLQSKVTELEKKLSSSHSAVTSESLNSGSDSSNQVGSGQTSEEDYKHKLFDIFQAFLHKHSNQIGFGQDLVPQIPIAISNSESDPQPSTSSAAEETPIDTEPSDQHDSNTGGGAFNVDEARLVEKVPSAQRSKASELLTELKNNFSSELTFGADGSITINNETLPEGNIYDLFPLLYKKVNSYECKKALARVVDEICSLGLGHLINRHYTLGLTPGGKNYLKDRHEIRKNLHKSQPWYYVENNE